MVDMSHQTGPPVNEERFPGADPFGDAIDVDDGREPKFASDDSRMGRGRSDFGHDSRGQAK